MDYNFFLGVVFFMKLGVFTVLFSDKTLDEMLDHVAAKGIEAVELARAATREMLIARLTSCWQMRVNRKSFWKVCKPRADN